MTQQSDQESNASIVIEYDEIAGDKEVQFRQWQSEIRAGLQQFQGYLKTDLCPPVQGLQDKWYIVVHFDSPTHLGEWLDSEVRHRIISKGKKKFGPYRYKIQTGFEGWFSKVQGADPKQLAPSAWKQNFAVLFGLYPTVMIETLLFSKFGFLETWSLAPKMFVSNLISCSLLTWVVMPLTTTLLNFWLKPQTSTALGKPQPLTQNNLIGTGLIFMGYGFMIAIFQAIAR